MTSVFFVYIIQYFFHFFSHFFLKIIIIINYVFYTFFHSISWHGLLWKNGIKQLPTNLFYMVDKKSNKSISRNFCLRIFCIKIRELWKVSRKERRIISWNWFISFENFITLLANCVVVGEVLKKKSWPRKNIGFIGGEKNSFF